MSRICTFKDCQCSGPVHLSNPAVEASYLQSRLISLGGFERLDQSRVPDVGHLGVPTVVGVDAVTVITRAAEAGELVDDPDGRLGAVLLCGPGGDGPVELLDLRVEVAQSEGDDLCDLIKLDISHAPLSCAEMDPDTHHNLDLGVVIAHLLDQGGERGNDISHGLVLLHDIVGAKMHGDHIGRVPLEPSDQLLLVGDVDCQEAGMTLVVAVVLGVAAVVLCLSGADKVDGGPLGRLQLVPELGAPADDLGDGVAEGHVPQSGRVGLRRDGSGEAEEREDGRRGYHFCQTFES